MRRNERTKGGQVGGWMDGSKDGWKNRGNSYASSRCSIYTSALYVFAGKRDVG